MHLHTYRAYVVHATTTNVPTFISSRAHEEADDVLHLSPAFEVRSLIPPCDERSKTEKRLQHLSFSPSICC